MKFSDEEIGERLAAGTQEEEKGGAPLEGRLRRELCLRLRMKGSVRSQD